MQNMVEEQLRAAKAAVSAPAGSTAGYTNANLQSVQQYMAPSANVEGLLAESKASQEKAATDNRDTLLQGIGQSYTTGMENVNKTAGEAQRQNYISHQMQQRNIGQQLAAAGLNGGAAESTILGLANAYGENRRLTEKDRLQQAAALEAERAQQETAAHTDYNTLMAGIANDYAQQLAAARQAETDRQAQLLMQKFAADQSAAQAEAERAWQQQQNEYNWQQQMAMADKELAAQLQLLAAKSAGSGEGSSGGAAAAAANQWAYIGVTDDKAEGFAADLNKAITGVMSKTWALQNRAALEREYGEAAAQMLIANAHDPTQEQMNTQNLIANALDQQAAQLAQANANKRNLVSVR